MSEVLRYAAFTNDPAGGNPAGVVLDASNLGAADMQRIATEVGYSETAFLVPRATPGDYDVRYFSPLAEVPFCGHATIASAVALAERGAPEVLVLYTAGGAVPVTIGRDQSGRPVATLTSVVPHVEPAAPDDLARALAALHWDADDLDPELPPRMAYAGARHLVLAAVTRVRLAELDYEFGALQELMREQDWTTVAMVWREEELRFHARNAFPPGGVVEDPATGAAAAAFGAYLRDLQLVEVPASIEIFQGDDMGRPGYLRVDLRDGDPRVRVTGSAVEIPSG